MPQKKKAKKVEPKKPPCVECESTDWEEMECPECYALKKTCCETAGAGCRCFSCEGA